MFFQFSNMIFLQIKIQDFFPFRRDQVENTQIIVMKVEMKACTKKLVNYTNNFSNKHAFEGEKEMIYIMVKLVNKWSHPNTKR